MIEKLLLTAIYGITAWEDIFTEVTQKVYVL